MSKKTKDKILDVAENLFSAEGFDNTSLRSITAEAEVNLASVNYHFGSKKSLIQAVLERYMSTLMPAMEAQLIELENTDEAISVEQVLASLVDPLLSLHKVKPNGSVIFLRLIGRGYTESQGHLRKFIMGNYGHVMSRFMEVMHKATPHLPPVEVFWRLHFALGTMVFTATSEDALIDIAQSDYDEEGKIRRNLARMVRFVAYGISAPETIYE